MNIEIYIAVVDTAIILWLIGTWFYEGHHKKCKVTTICRNCDQQHSEDCQS